MSRAPRRVVTGLAEDGRSTIIIDGPVPQPAPVANLIWRSASVPADNSGSTDMGGAFDMAMLHDGGTNFIYTELPPGLEQGALMHATDTIDYLVVISGEVTLVLESEEVVLRAGDFIVDRGINHGWRNDGEEPAVYVSVTIPAKPVGKGRTV
jgi:mannose-6-phosphate isomerase-like protein (cupin superfamily)